MHDEDRSHGLRDVDDWRDTVCSLRGGVGGSR
jgi:hypothetical protein